ncbi:hypothetical protein QVD17_39755 [Tagetes erecta]|uniref:Uncharacterized protein n=1 Tax=Tagetes erecta TaxID=13708 RepID=A0AAD8NHE7_TARER|nr:hypothetical protein QVD17_39755 [Tagetes erecta]
MADSSSSKFQNMIFYLEGFDLEIRCSDFFVYFPSFASFTDLGYIPSFTHYFKLKLQKDLPLNLLHQPFKDMVEP